MLDRKAARARCEVATAGPWHTDGCVVFREDGVPILAMTTIDPAVDGCGTLDEASLTAEARTDLPEALTLLDRAEVLLQRAEERLDLVTKYAKADAGGLLADIRGLLGDLGGDDG
jgi:hypothetical protein